MENFNNYNKVKLYTLAVENSDDRFMFFNLEKIGEAKHHDGTITDVMLSRIVQYKYSDDNIIDSADYVGFEVLHGRRFQYR